MPWARGFTGKVEISCKEGVFVCTGNVTRLSNDTVEISELPIGRWTKDYKVNGDKLSTITSIGVVLALVGVFCASGPELSQGLPLKPLLLAFGAAIGFGIALTSISIGSQSSALMTMVSMRGATFFVTVALALKFHTMGGFSKKEYPSLIFIGIADFLANVLLGVACTKGLVSIAMVLGSLFPIATALLAFKFLHERLQKVQYVGIALAVAGVALISSF